jgi:hypothetical protein
VRTSKHSEQGWKENGILFYTIEFFKDPNVNTPGDISSDISGWAKNYFFFFNGKN